MKSRWQNNIFRRLVRRNRFTRKAKVFITFWSADIFETLTFLVLHNAIRRPIETPKRNHHRLSWFSLGFPTFFATTAHQAAARSKLYKNCYEKTQCFFLLWETAAWMNSATVPRQQLYFRLIFRPLYLNWPIWHLPLLHTIFVESTPFPLSHTLI